MNRKLGWLLLSVGLVWLSGCKSPMAAGPFNTKLILANKKISSAAESFRDFVKPLKDGQQPNMADVRLAHDKLEKTLAQVRAEIEGIAPPDTSSGEALYNAYLKFLDTEDSLFKNEIGKIMKTLEGPGLPDTKWAAVQSSYGKIKVEERLALSDLKEKQKAFAKDEKITLSGGGGGGPP
jgi:hypothetical protein